jgi:8-oxo-dGTP diphosphatase
MKSNPMEYPNPILTVDAVLLGLFEDTLKLALVRRAADPYAGSYALPGGFVHADEDKDATAAMARVLREKLHFKPAHLEQVFTQSGADRDPRGWSASVVYLALARADMLQHLADTQTVTLFDTQPQSRLPEMAFDHAALVRTALARLRDKAGYTTIVGHFLPRSFPFAAFHRAYETVRQQRVNLPAFRRKVMDAGVLKEIGDSVHSRGRPAAAYMLRAPLAYFDKDLGGKA